MANKIELMQAAATLTQAAMAGRGAPATPVPIDATMQEVMQRNLNLETWEVFRAFYTALDGAVADDTNWIPPPAGSPAGPAIPSVIVSTLSSPTVQTALAAAVAADPRLGVLPGLLKGFGIVLPAVAPAAATAPPPNPGVIAPTAGS